MLICMAAVRRRSDDGEIVALLLMIGISRAQSPECTLVTLTQQYSPCFVNHMLQ